MGETFQQRLLILSCALFALALAFMLFDLADEVARLKTMRIKAVYIREEAPGGEPGASVAGPIEDLA